MSAEHVRQELGGGRAWRAPHPVDRRTHPLDTSSAGAIVEVVSTAAGATDVIEGDKRQLLLSGECQLVVELGHRASPGASTTMPGEAPLDARTVRASRLQPVSSSSHPEPATRRRQDADQASQERILTPHHPEPAPTPPPNTTKTT